MNKEKIIALDKFLREQNISVKDLSELAAYAEFYKGLPLLENGETLALELRYADDNSVSTTFTPFRPIKAVHLNGINLSFDDAPIPMPFYAAEKFCEQKQMRLMTSAEGLILYSEFQKLNAVLKQLCKEPLKEYLYWLADDGPKSYLGKIIDFRTGQIKEVHKKESYRVRPIF